VVQEVVQEAAGDGEEGGGEEMAEVDIVGTMSIHQAFSTGRRRSACVLDDHPRRCSQITPLICVAARSRQHAFAHHPTTEFRQSTSVNR